MIAAFAWVALGVGVIAAAKTDSYDRERTCVILIVGALWALVALELM